MKGLGDAIGSDGSVYYERGPTTIWTVWRPNGSTAVGPMLDDKPTGLGGGGGAVRRGLRAAPVWASASPPAQGLDATYTTYDAAST